MNRYFGAFNNSKRDRWVFGDRVRAPIAPSPPGLALSHTRWSRAERLQMIRPSPSSGLTDGVEESPRRWTNSACT